MHMYIHYKSVISGKPEVYHISLVFRVFDQVRHKHERINLKENISSIYVLEKKNCFGFVLKKKYFGSRTVRKNLYRKKILRKKKKTAPPPPRPSRKSNGQSLNRFSRDVDHIVSCYFLVYFHCNKQYKKANKTDRHPRYPFFHCHLYRHYRNSSHVSCRVILTR